ncbi:C1 family peptidase [bacterium]|nr:C1 family peptidase [bacterium]
MKKLSALVFLMVGLFVFAADIPPEKLARLDSIRAAIRQKGARWTADINPIFLMPDDQFQKMLGIRDMPEPEELRDSVSSFAPKSTLDLPDSFDWRNYLGRDWTTPIRSQDGCGSCWAFATIGAFEASINIALDSAEYDPNLSEQHLVSCDASSRGCDGGHFAGSMLLNTGVVDESCFPYAASDLPCDDKCADWERHILFRSAGNSWVSNSIDQIKAAVYRHPIYTSMDVYEDFDSYSGGVYEHVWGSYRGGHAVVIVGWNDADSCWICKNSWGTWWGESGWFRIKYGDSDIGSGSDEIAEIAARVWSHSSFDQVFPDTGIGFFKIDTTVYFLANSPVMGESDTVFRVSEAQISAFRYDSVIFSDSFTLTIDGPTEVWWLWDTVTGVPKSSVRFLSNYPGVNVNLEYMNLTTEVSVEWMAESVVTISADSHQTIDISDVRQVVISFDHWSDGGALSHQITMPSEVAEDTHWVYFSEDTVRFLITFLSNHPSLDFYVDGHRESFPYEEFMDSASAHNAYAYSKIKRDRRYFVFEHWTPDLSGGSGWIGFSVDSVCTLFANYREQFMVFFSTDFGWGNLMISDSVHPTGFVEIVDSGAAVNLQIAPPQKCLGNYYVFSQWSDGIDTAHQFWVDSLPESPIVEYTQRMSRVVVQTPYSTPVFEDSIAPPDSPIWVGVEDSIVSTETERHICRGWYRKWTRFDTLLYSSFEETEFPPPGWRQDSLSSFSSLHAIDDCLPVHGDSFCTFYYSPWSEPYLITDTFFIPSGSDSAFLWFWFYHGDYYADGNTLFVLISTNYGAHWDTLREVIVGGLDHTWRKYWCNLEAYKGDSVMIKFLPVWDRWWDHFIIDNVLSWAAYSCADSGAGDSLAFLPEWNCTVSFRWDDQYHLAVVSPYGTPTGEGWYYPDSAAVVSVEDTVYDGGWVYVFAGWTGAVSSEQNPCTLVVSAPGTVFAVWDTFLQAAVMPTIDGAIATVDGDTAPWSAILSPDSDSVWVDFVSPCSVGADSQAVFISWSDGAAEPHWARFSSPGTLWAQFEYQFRVRAVKNPPTGAGWISLGADTATDSLYAWVFEDSAVWISASDTDFNFTVETTYVFQSFSDGVDTAHSLAVAAPMRVEALYSAEVMTVEIALASDSVWTYPDSLDAGETVQMGDGDEFVFVNGGNCPIDFGMRFLSASEVRWAPDTVQAPFRFILMGRFEDSAPAVYNPATDLVDTTSRWADDNFGSGGFEVYPGDTARVWFHLALPTYYDSGGEHWIKIAVMGKISMP